MPNVLWVLVAVLLIFALLGAPWGGTAWHGYGWYPSGGFGLVFVVLLLFLLLGR